MSTEYRDNLYTPIQSKILSIIPMFSAPLSIIGSGTIIYIIMSDRKRKLQRVYHRLLLAYSTFDLIFSINLALSAAVVPKGTPGVWGAVGNQATCEASGFVSQFGQSSGLYAAFMCLYYVLILRYNVREETIAKRVEPLIHGLAFLFPLSFASAMLALDMYNPTNIVIGWCFINAYPADCTRRDEVKCERGENYRLWLLITTSPFFAYFAVVSISCLLICVTVWKLELRSSAQSLFNRQSKEKTKETSIQALLYVVTFLITYTFFSVSTFVGPSPATEENRGFYFSTTVLIKLFLPLQGVWNFFIFVRPRYSALKHRNPQLNLGHILNQIIFHSSEEAQRKQMLKLRTEKEKVQHATSDECADVMINIIENEDAQDEFAPQSSIENTEVCSELRFDEHSGRRARAKSEVQRDDDNEDDESCCSAGVSMIIPLSHDHGLSARVHQSNSSKEHDAQHNTGTSASFLAPIMESNEAPKVCRGIETGDSAVDAFVEGDHSRKVPPRRLIFAVAENQNDAIEGVRTSKHPPRPSILEKGRRRDGNTRRSLAFLDNTLLGGADF